MNIKLHNKFEIVTNNKTYTAYNTVLHTIFDKITKLEPYSTYIAFGKGTDLVDYNGSKMSNFVASYKSELEEIQCDPSKGKIYVKRVVSLDEDAANGLEFCELGITDSAEDDPIIYNHIQITDSDGEPITIIKEAGQSMLIRVTIFLELSASSSAYLSAGDNLLVRAILGEYASSADFTVARGYNLQPNVSIKRNAPSLSAQSECTFDGKILEDGTPAIDINFDIGSGETAEIVVLLGGECVARLNALEYKEPIEESLSLVSQSNYTIDCGEYVKEIVDLQTADGTSDTGYKAKSYASDFSDEINGPFDENISASDPRWVSKDGDKLGFVNNGTFYLYKNENYCLYKIANNVPTNELAKVIIFENYIFAWYNTSPYLRAFVINGQEAAEAGVNFGVYDTNVGSYDWQSLEIIDDDDGNFTLGIILGASARNPLIVKAKFVDGVFTVVSTQYGATDYIVSSFSLYKNNFCNSMIGFITNNLDGTEDSGAIEQYYSDGTSEIKNQIFAYYFIHNCVSVEGKSRALVAKRSVEPYIWLLYYPQQYRYAISLDGGVQNWISTNLLYLVQKDSAGGYKIYSLTNYNNPQEFARGLPEDIDQTTITDFEFLQDTLLIFTTGGVRAFNLKLTSAVIENVANKDTEYSVTYKKYNLLGSSDTEGIKGSLSVEFDV